MLMARSFYKPVFSTKRSTPILVSKHEVLPLYDQKYAEMSPFIFVATDENGVMCTPFQVVSKHYNWNRSSFIKHQIHQ